MSDASRGVLVVTLAAYPLALLALLRAHRRPPALVFVAFPILGGALRSPGSIPPVAATALVLYAYALAARLADARPWPGGALVAANVAVGLALCLVHPVAFLLWLPGLVIYVGVLRSLKFMAPAAALFAWLLARAPDPRAHVRIGSIAGPSERVWPLLVLGAALVAALALVEREVSLIDQRPLVLAAVLGVAFFVLPRDLAACVPLVFFPVAAVCGGGGKLPGWRAAVVVIPLGLAAVL